MLPGNLLILGVANRGGQHRRIDCKRSGRHETLEVWVGCRGDHGFDDQPPAEAKDAPAFGKALGVRTWFVQVKERVGGNQDGVERRWGERQYRHVGTHGKRYQRVIDAAEAFEHCQRSVHADYLSLIHI